MKHKIWMTQIPIVIGFTFFFWVTELGVHGQLESPFLREKAYPLLSRVSNILTDLKFNSRGPRQPQYPVVVVEIDGASLESYGRWPWHRDLTALLIQKIFAAGAKVVGLDMAFTEPDPRVPSELVELLRTQKVQIDLNQFESDQTLTDLIYSYSDRLVLGWASETECQPFYEKDPRDCPVTDPEAMSLFPKDFDKFSIEDFSAPRGFDPAQTPMISFVTPLANIPIYNAVAKHLGYFNSSLDPDGYIRRSNLIVIARGKPYPSLPLEMARIGLKEKLQLTLGEDQRVKSLSFVPSGRSIPVSPLGVMQINFRGPNTVFKRVSAAEILGQSEGSAPHGLPTQVLTQVLKDAYVLIGLSALGVFDMRQFPFESNAPGVYGHANILENILASDPLVSVATNGIRILFYLLMTIGVLIFAFLIEWMEAVPALLFFSFNILFIYIIDFKFIFQKNYNFNTSFFYIEFAVVFFIVLASKYVLEEKNKKFIRSAFVKYVAPEVVDSILKDPSKLSLGGEKKEVSILFCDIRNFTKFSESMDAKVLASFLNDYLGLMTNVIFSNHGTLDKYIGDAIMAFWGAPIAQPNHAFNSCKAALEMVQLLNLNQERFKKEYGIDVMIGIGINSGVVNVGNMGSNQNFSYTVIGDHVNLSSRMESLTKKYGVSIMTSRFSFDRIQDSGQVCPPHRVLDRVKVKGKTHAVELIQLLEKEYPQEGLELFESGRSFYRDQKWSQASAQFEAAHRVILEKLGSPDGPSLLFVDRCRSLQGRSLGVDWDGCWEMETK